MSKFRDNLLVRFSLTSFVIVFALAFGLAYYLSSGLGHQIEDMQIHNAAMVAHNAMMAEGSFDSMSQQGNSADSANGMQDGMAMIDTMLPTANGSSTFDSRATAMDMESDTSMAHIIQNVSDIKKTTLGLVGGAFMVLYTSLVFIVWGGWKTIDRQKASLVTANTEMEL